MLRKASLNRLLACLDEALPIAGDVAECGVGNGGTACAIAERLVLRRSDKLVHLFDTFTGHPDLATPEERRFWQKRKHRQVTGHTSFSIEQVESALLPFTNYRIHAGLFSDTFPQVTGPFCLVHADANQYLSMLDAFRLANRRVPVGGFLVVHDWNYPHIRRAATECLAPSGWQRVALTANSRRQKAFKRISNDST